MEQLLLLNRIVSMNSRLQDKVISDMELTHFWKNSASQIQKNSRLKSILTLTIILLESLG